MSRKYKFKNPEGLYFVTFAVEGWVNVFTRNEYKNILIDNLAYCQIFVWHGLPLSSAALLAKKTAPAARCSETSSFKKINKIENCSLSLIKIKY